MLSRDTTPTQMWQPNCALINRMERAFCCVWETLTRRSELPMRRPNSGVCTTLQLKKNNSKERREMYFRTMRL